VQLATLGEFLEWAEAAFVKAGIHFGHGTNNAWDESVLIASFVLKLPPNVDRTVISRILTASEKKAFIDLVERRINERIPIPYLIHEAWFADLKFYIDERVIIPRSPLAELIQNGFQPWLGDRPVRRILDLCTGSGCIAIACAKVFEEASIDAVDISDEALLVAKTNVQDHHCENQVKLIGSDLFKSCVGQYDIIISNPPYVSSQELQVLPKEYRHEPELALAAGVDGLDIVKRILKDAPHFLAPEGLLIVEVGNSAEALCDQYSEIPFTWLEFERGGEGVFLLEAKEMKNWQVFSQS